jgi:hypothetical protein
MQLKRGGPNDIRFWSHTMYAGDCIVWTAAFVHDGYGLFKVNGKMVRAHRFAYELANGPIGQGLVLNHICRNRACVNAAHLEAVLATQNTLHHESLAPSNLNRMKTICPSGHAYDDKNTYFDRNGGRQCRECRKVTTREHKRRIRQHEALSAS